MLNNNLNNKIDERETIRFEHKKNYIVFIARK